MSTDANSLSSLSLAQELLGTEKISVSVCVSHVGRIAANNIDICLSVCLTHELLGTISISVMFAYLSHAGIAAANIGLSVCLSCLSDAGIGAGLNRSRECQGFLHT